MIKIKIQSNSESIRLNCPFCHAWEELGIDDPRKRLHSLPILRWEPDKEDENEVSHHQCIQCNSRFRAEWDYQNTITE